MRDSGLGSEPAAGNRCASLTWLPWVGIAFAALLLAWRSQPANVAAGSFSSDTAIPLLMANADSLTPFHLFYFGQDRFGGWPYIVAWIVGRLGSFGWTPELLYGFQALVVFSAAWPVARLGGAWGHLLAVAYLISVGLDPDCLALDVAQPYGWQLSTLLWSWWALRLGCEGYARGVRRRGLLWGAAASASLSGWLSPFSVLAILIVAVIEVARCRLISARSARPVPLRRLAGFAVTPALISIGFGVLVTLGHLAYAHARGFRYQHTAMRLDVGHLGQNLLGMLQARSHLGWWPLAPLATAGVAAAAWRLHREGWRMRTTLRPGLEGVVRLAKEDAPLATLDLEATAIAAWLVGTANFALFVLISWARINEYSPRYLTLSQVSWMVAAVAASIVLGSAGARRLAGAPRIASAVCVAATVVIAGWAASSARANPTLHQLREAARALGASGSPTVLFGDYWGTYLFAGVEPGVDLFPAVAERSLDRMPWQTRRLSDAGRVVVSHWAFPRAGEPDHPASALFERDTLLVLAGPHLASGPYRFSAYDNRTPAAAKPVDVHLGAESVGPAATDGKSGTVVDGLDWRAGGAPLLVGFPPMASGRILLFFDRPEATPLVPSIRVEAPDSKAESLRVSRGRDVLILDFEEALPVARVSLERLDRDEPVRLREVLALPEARPAGR